MAALATKQRQFHNTQKIAIHLAKQCHRGETGQGELTFRRVKIGQQVHFGYMTSALKGKNFSNALGYYMYLMCHFSYHIWTSPVIYY